MNNENEILKDLLVGGIIGATLGALIADDKQEGVAIGTIAGAVLLATLNASQEAKKTQVPIYVQENSNLYEITSDGKKRFVKKIEKSLTQVDKHFILN